MRLTKFVIRPVTRAIIGQIKTCYKLTSCETTWVRSHHAQALFRRLTQTCSRGRWSRQYHASRGFTIQWQPGLYLPNARLIASNRCCPGQALRRLQTLSTETLRSATTAQSAAHPSMTLQERRNWLKETYTLESRCGSSLCPSDRLLV
jgi:hypothetical protein